MLKSTSSAASSAAGLSHRGSSRGSLRHAAAHGQALDTSDRYDPAGSSGPDSPSASAAIAAAAAAGSVPVETLVELLLRAKRSLSTMTLVLRANDLTTQARQLHEGSVVLAAQTTFLQRSIAQQVAVLERVRKGLGRTYDAGRREFDRLVKTLDGAHNRLKRQMEMLAATHVDLVFRPPGEETRNLLFFVDINGVDSLTGDLTQSIDELKAAERSFDGDLLRFDTDLRSLRKLLSSSPGLPSPSLSSGPQQPIAQLVHALTDQSHQMATNLSSLTSHFDLCVTAVRASEGGTALALRKAAEVDPLQKNEDPISISGVMGGGDGQRDRHGDRSSGTSSRASRHPPEEVMSPEDRADMFKVVVQDAAEVDDVVRDIQTWLAEMESDFASVQHQEALISRRHASTLEALGVLEDISARLASYVESEKEYTDRCDAERRHVADKLDEIESLGRFYEGYMGAYDSLVLEYERRSSVERKIRQALEKARDQVTRLIEADAQARQNMAADIGEYLPTDLWVGMNDPLRRWKLVPDVDVQEEDSPPAVDAPAVAAFDELAASVASMSPTASSLRHNQQQRRRGAASAGEGGSSAATVLGSSVVQAAKERLGRVR